MHVGTSIADKCEDTFTGFIFSSVLHARIHRVSLVETCCIHQVYFVETICIHQVSCCGNLPLLGVSKYKETHSFPRIGNVRNLTGNVCLHLVS